MRTGKPVYLSYSVVGEEINWIKDAFLRLVKPSFILKGQTRRSDHSLFRRGMQKSVGLLKADEVWPYFPTCTR